METQAEPTFLRAAGHEVRWRLLLELAASDRQVHELVALVGQPQNLVSYHLGQLRRASLVSARRSSADGRDMYYRLDLANCAEQLQDVGGALHPGLRLTRPPVAAPSRGRRRIRVLFLCTGNSSRSQMAEALLRHRAGSAVVVRSAGIRPKPVHPDAVRVMAGYGIDLGSARSKHLDRYRDEIFDYVVSLCDRLREDCPELPGPARIAHWSVPDPSADPEGYPAFERVAAELSERIDFFRYVLGTVHNG